MSKKISVETKESIVRMYKSRPMPISCLCKEFNLCAPVISKILAQYHVKLWGKAELFSPELNQRYFQYIDSPSKAYFLGLITTDGCVFWKNKKLAVLTIELQSRDAYILEAFMREVKCNRKLVYNPKTDTFAATVSSTQMVQDLEQYKVTQRSSLTQEFPSNIPHEYLSDYLRGLIDGDGSYAFYSRPGRRVHKKAVRMCCANKAFMEAFVDCMAKATGANHATISVEHGPLYTCAWARNNDVEAIIKYLYSHDGYCLHRKKEIADKILDEIRQYRDNRQSAAS